MDIVKTDEEIAKEAQAEKTEEQIKAEETQKQTEQFMEKIGIKELSKIASQVGVGNIASLGIFKGSRALAGSMHSLQKIEKLRNIGIKALKKGDRQKAIDSIRKAKKLIEEVMGNTGNYALLPIMSLLDKGIASDLEFLESGKDLSEYNSNPPENTMPK